MSNELVVINNAAPAQDNGNWGDDDTASVPQFIRMKQALTEGQDHLSNGTFFEPNSGQTWTTINMIPLKMSKTRQWKPSAPKFVADEKALCRSNDGKFPVRGDDRLVPQVPQGKDCASCPKASWDGYDKASRTGPKPTCDRGFTFLFLDEETNLPYIYNASGQGYDPSVAVYEAIRSRAKVVKAKTGTMPNTWEFSIQMTAEKGNKAFRPKFTTVRQLKPEDAAKFGPLYDQFVTSRNQPKNDVVEDGEYVDSVDDTGAVDETVEI